MQKEEVVTYLRTQFAGGATKEQVKARLTIEGWSPQEIDEAFSAFEAAPAPVPPAAVDVKKASGGVLLGGHARLLNEQVSGTRTAAVKVLLLLCLAAGLGVSLYFGIRDLIPSDLSLALFISKAGSDQRSMLLFLLPAVGLALISLLIGWLWGRHIYRRENHPILGFLFGISVYVLMTYGTIQATFTVMSHYAKFLPEAGSFVVGLVISMFFLASVQILYVGFLLCMLLLIFFTRSYAQSPAEPMSSFALFFRCIVIGGALLMSFYIFGVFGQIAPKLHEQRLCNFVYDAYSKAECMLNTSAS
jgi:hypothetical protein